MVLTLASSSVLVVVYRYELHQRRPPPEETAIRSIQHSPAYLHHRAFQSPVLAKMTSKDSSDTGKPRGEGIQDWKCVGETGESQPRDESFHFSVDPKEKRVAQPTTRNSPFVLEVLKELMHDMQAKKGSKSAPIYALEIASGTGQQSQFFCEALPNLYWLTTEYERDCFPSIGAYAQEVEGGRVGGPSALDASRPQDWLRNLSEGVQEEKSSHPGANTSEEDNDETQNDAQRNIWGSIWRKNFPQASHDNQRSSLRDNEGFDLVYTCNLTHISPWSVTEGMIEGAGKHLRSGGLLVVYGPFKRDGKFTTESNKNFDQALRERDSRWGLRDVGELKDVAEKHGMKLTRVQDMPANNFILAFEK